jgi:hypothetical protein
MSPQLLTILVKSALHTIFGIWRTFGNLFHALPRSRAVGTNGAKCARDANVRQNSFPGFVVAIPPTTCALRNKPPKVCVATAAGTEMA